MRQKADDRVSRDWEESLKYAENLKLAGHSDWRLSNAKELQSIVDYSRSPQTTNSLAIDPIFGTSEIEYQDGNPGHNLFFWTSTSHLDRANPYASAATPKSGNSDDYPKYWGPRAMCITCTNTFVLFGILNNNPELSNNNTSDYICIQMIEFPNPNLADDEGLIAQGGELSPEFLLSAYCQGIFPWFCYNEPILWWSPNPRMVLFPENFKLRKSLRQLINKGTFELRIDTAFRVVITNCSHIPRPGQDETWITKDIIEAYVKLHELGFAHSFETYFNNELVGGLYGISVGNCFFGESMFFTKTDASKVAFYHLVQFAIKNNFAFIDAQQPTGHLHSLGAEPVPRNKFLQLLQTSLQKETLQGKWTDLK